MDYGDGDLKKEPDTLHERLVSHGFVMDSYVKKHIGRRDARFNIVLSGWKTADGGVFCVLYIQMDCLEAFNLLYGQYANPRCVCNISYEPGYSDSKYGKVHDIEKRCDFIMGHCHDDDYAPMRTYPYYGDYGEEEVMLFGRLF